MLRNPELPDGFQEVFIGKIYYDGCSMCDFLLIVGGEVKGQCPRNLVLSLKFPSSM